MRECLRRSILVLAGAALLGCGDGFGPITELPRELTSVERALVDADNDFAVRIFERVNAQSSADSNLFLSPLSISVALGMTINGAGGETMDAIAATLGFSGLQIDEINQGYRGLIDLLVELDPRVTMNIANSLWHRPEFSVQAAFLDALATFFDARVEALDFGAPNAPDIIDQWVSDHTNGLIESIAPRPIRDEIVMFLINAVYFKGDWTHRFDESLTMARPFTLLDGTEKSVPTMRHEDDVPVRIGGDDLVDLLELSYGGDAFTMVAAVPRPGVTLEEVVEEFDAVRWNQWVASLDSTDMTVVMPKFEFEYSVRLNDILSDMGMAIAFDPNLADFSGINPTAELYIDRVQHKAFVRVDEVGTEAAAATSVDFGVTSAPPVFQIDRPFIFVLRERISGTILFMGKVVDPAP